MRKLSSSLLTLSGAVALALVASPALAATPAPAGHNDIIEIECSANGDIEFGSHIGGVHVAPEDLDDWEFVFPSGAGVSYASGAWAIDAELNSALPDLGFNDEAESALCSDIAIDITGATFNGQSTVVLTPNEHVHGIWSVPAASSAPLTASIEFEVSSDDESVVYAPAAFVIGG